MTRTQPYPREGTLNTRFDLAFHESMNVTSTESSILARSIFTTSTNQGETKELGIREVESSVGTFGFPRTTPSNTELVGGVSRIGVDCRSDKAGVEPFDCAAA